MSLAVLTAALVACQKNEIPASEEVQGIPMTLTASLPGDYGTKTTVEADVSGLKTTWDATESISVVTLDATGNSAGMVSVDTFTSTGAAGRTNAEFTGTFTGGATPAKVIVVYPALELQADNTYQTPEYAGALGNRSILAGLTVSPPGTMFSDASEDIYLWQGSDGSFDHFKNYCVMTGNVDLTDIQSNKLTVKLRNLMAVIKFVAKFPDSCKGNNLDEVRLESFQSDASNRNLFHDGGATYLNIEECGLAFPGSGEDNYNQLECSFKIPDTGTATLYMPLVFMEGAKNLTGDYWKMTAYVEGDTKLAQKTFTKDVTYEAGKVYTVNVTFSE